VAALPLARLVLLGINSDMILAGDDVGRARDSVKAANQHEI